jgi:hypothetical protein
MTSLRETLFESPGKQPFLAKRCTGMLTRDTHEHANRGAGLRARCTTCRASASDWRHLLGVGASVVVNSLGMFLTYPGAWAKCGASQLLVESYPVETAAIAT